MRLTCGRMIRTIVAAADVPRGLRVLGAQTLRYAIGGTFTTVVYVGLVLGLSGPADVPIQLAIVIGYGTALAIHFRLQHRFVFRRDDGFALERRHQLRRYLTTAATQYSLAALSTGLLPGILGVHEQIVYVVTALSLAAVTFLVLRTHVFH
jgi:putative flippase GtrA